MSDQRGNAAGQRRVRYGWWGLLGSARALRFLVAEVRRDGLAPIWLYQLIAWETELRGGRHRRYVARELACRTPGFDQRFA